MGLQLIDLSGFKPSGEDLAETKIRIDSFEVRIVDGNKERARVFQLCAFAFVLGLIAGIALLFGIAILTT